MKSPPEFLNEFQGLDGPLTGFLANSKSVVIGLFNHSGTLLYSNAGLNQFIHLSGLKDSPSSALVNPDWNKISSMVGSGSVFQGKLTLGNQLNKSYSFDAEIFNLASGILLVGEADAEELFSQNSKLSLLNQQVNNLQHQLIKEKKALERALHDLDVMNQEKNKYIGMVAHDLRNPIGLAQSFAQLLVENYCENTFEDNKKQLEIIEKSCSFSINLITEMLDISKIEAGILTLHSGSFDYIEFCRTVVARNRIFAKKKNQEIILTTDHESLILEFDPYKIEQVLDNLIGNALKFSQPGQELRVNITQSGDYVRTEIIDQGQGMPPEELNNIFQPFNSGSSIPTGGEKSYGLGLAIVKRILDAHNGIVNFLSEPGKGLAVFFQLPL
jgi:signal transduction histidine kinase